MSPLPPTKNLKPKLTLTDFSISKTTTIHLGAPPTHTTLIISQQTLTSLALKSTFFHTHSARQTGSISLPDTDPDSFGLFLVFVSGGEFTDFENYIAINFKRPMNRQGDLKKRLSEQWTQLAHAYILGLHLGASEFRNVVIDQVIRNTMAMHEGFDLVAGTGTDDIELVFENTKRGDPLRRLVVDAVVGLGREDWEPRFERWYKVCFREFLIEWGCVAHGVVKRIRDERWLREGSLRWRDRCAYHVHEGRLEDYCCVDYEGLEEKG